MPRDPYEVLGVSRGASDADLRAAYRRLVLLHHPDHNAGSVESARRFEEVQDAYSAVMRLRKGSGQPRASQSQPGPDPDLDARLADMERELREANAARERARDAAERARDAARERARQAARDAAEADGRASGFKRPSDEELGYVKTDDSFSQILSDAAAELSERLGEARQHPAGKRISDLIGELADRLKDVPPR